MWQHFPATYTKSKPTMLLENFNESDFFTQEYPDFDDNFDFSFKQSVKQPNKPKQKPKFQPPRTNPTIDEYKLWLFFIATITQYDRAVSKLLHSSYKKIITLKQIFDITKNGFVFAKFISSIYDVKIIAMNESQKGFVNNNWKRSFLVLKEDVRIPTEFLFKIDDLTSETEFYDIFFGILAQISEIFTTGLSQSTMYAQQLFSTQPIYYTQTALTASINAPITTHEPNKQPHKTPLSDLNQYLNHYRIPSISDASWADLQHFQTLINVVFDKKFKLPFQNGKQAFQVIQNAKFLAEFLSKNSLFSENYRDLQAVSEGTVLHIVNRIMAVYPHLKLVGKTQPINQKVENQILNELFKLGILTKNPYNFDQLPPKIDSLLEFFNSGVLIVDIAQIQQWLKGNFVLLKPVRTPLTRAEKRRNFNSVKEFLPLEKACHSAGVLVNSLDQANTEIATVVLAYLLGVNLKQSPENDAICSEETQFYVSSGQVRFSNLGRGVQLQDWEVGGFVQLGDVDEEEGE